MAKRIFGSTPWQITVDKDLAHRRLNVAQLTTLISHRTVRFSPHFRLGGRARCSCKSTRSGFPGHIRTHTGCPVHGTLDVRYGTPPP